MGINQSLYTGVSGLQVNSDGMAVLANNIANANTRSFKSDRAEFEDLLSINLNENASLGRGARLRNTATSFQQGSLTQTGTITDFGIQGDGFFMVKNEASDVQESGGHFYTRQGSFHFNKDGYLVDVNDGKLQGYMANKDGSINPKLSDVQIVTNNIPPSASTKVSINANLDARARPSPEFDIKNPHETSSHSSTVTLYDSMGRAHVATVYFAKQDTPDKNSWKWFATVDGKELAGDPEKGPDGETLPVVISQGDMNFDADGKLELPFRDANGRPTYIDSEKNSDAAEVQFSNGASAQKVQFNFGPKEDEGGILSNQSTTSSASKSITVYHSQNGFESGNLKTMRVDLDGSVRGVYTNGLERRIASLALATFQNNQGLQKSGRNMYIATSKSGEPRIGQPLSGNRGSIYNASLEESNVDLAASFVEMITTQRAFQANSKTITTTDTLLEEVINLKR